jgi:beta-phosphoglucomutase-like phosphatase (HAD superfamily)
MPLGAVLFDIDGTLVDSNDMHVTAWEEAFAKIDRHFERRVIHNQIGKGTNKLVPTLLPDLDDDAAEQLANKIMTALLQKRAELGFKPLCVAVLDAGGILSPCNAKTVPRRCDHRSRPPRRVVPLR